MPRIDSGHHLWRQSGFTFHPHETRYFHREQGKENEEDGGAWRLRRVGAELETFVWGGRFVLLIY